MSNPLLTLEELTALKALPGILEMEYKNANPERKELIEFAKKLSEDPALLASDEAADILMGAYIFIMESIYGTYKVLSASRSTLYDLLDKNLKKTIKQDAITKVDKVIYLAAFYRYLQTTAPENIAEKTKWVSHDALIRNLLKTARGVLWKQEAEVKCLLESLPKYSLLHRGLAKMEERYLKDCPKPGYLSFWSPPNGHQLQAKFIDLIIDYSETYLSKITDPNFDPALQVHESYLILVGANVCVLKYLEDECTVSSAQGRNLYEKCKAAMNVYSSQSIDLDYKIGGLECLKLHLTNMLEHRKDFLDQKEKEGYPTVRADIQKMRAKIAADIATYMKAQLAPSALHTGVASVTSGVTQAVLRSSVPSPVGMLVDTAAGMTGFAVFGPGGALLGSTLSRLVRTQLIPLAFASMFSGVLEKIGRGVGHTTAGVVLFPFECTARGLSALVNRYGDSFDKSELRKNLKWIEALMSFPDDVMEKQKKDVITKVSGVTEPPLRRYA